MEIAAGAAYNRILNERWAITGILVILAAALVGQAWHLGVTVDEPSHLLSADLYWHGRDHLPPHDMPPMIKLLGGWVPRLAGVEIPPGLGRPGDTRHEWLMSQKMVERMPPGQMQWVFFGARLTLLVFPLLTVWLVWRWARELFGPLAALVAAALTVAEPTALGHGVLFKNDLAATCTYLFVCYSAWNYWRRPSPRQAAILGAAVLAAVASKLSLVFVAVLVPLVVLARIRRAGSRPTAAALALVLLIPYLGLIVLYQFFTRRIPAAELAAAWHAYPGWFVLASHIFNVLPVPWDFWRGCGSLLQNNAGPMTIYLFGDLYPRGTPFYFIAALAVKIPAAIQLLLVAGVVSLVARRPKAEDLFWLLPGFLYIGLASFSALQLGVRLVLPALPFGMLLCAAGTAWLRSTRLAALPVAAAALVVAQGAVVYPHGISFINLPSGGSSRALAYLADSNVDWGQGLPCLRRWVDKHGVGKFRLSYFGNDNPFRFFSDEEVELVAPPWSPKWAKQPRLQPEPGYYAISATLLPGHFFEPRFRDYYAAFRTMKPVARAGGSIYIYKIGM